MYRLPVSLFAAAVVGLLSPGAAADRPPRFTGAGADAPAIAVGERGAPPAPEVVAIEADAPTDPFIPDVYPSRAAAARAAATQWATVNPRRWDQPPQRLRVMCDDASLFAPVRQAIGTRRPDLPVEPCDGTLCASKASPAGEAWVYVGSGPGSVSVRSTGWSDAVASAQFVDKPWVTHYTDFVTRNPGRWLVTHSDPARPAGSAAEAADSARRAAADSVVALVKARMPDPDRYDADRLKWIVEARLHGDRLVHDRFPQKFERPYGTLYREAVLLNVADAAIDPLASDVRRALEADRQSRLGGLAGAGAVLLVTYALYRFANAFTRGYFTWSLRTAAAVVAAGAVTLIAATA